MNDINNVFERYNRGDFNNKLPWKTTPRNEYLAEDGRIHDEFRNSLFETFDVVDNPKRDMAFAIAWQKGHSNGYGEVANEFADLVDLIRD